MLKKYKNGQKKPRKGQSTVEYMILVAAILAALLIFLRPNGVFQNAFNTTLNTGTTGMVDLANRMADSRPIGE